jgi:hypothetical protein
MSRDVISACRLRFFEKAQIPRMANPGLSAVERIEICDAIPDDNFFCAEESKLQLRHVSELFKI